MRDKATRKNLNCETDAATSQLKIFLIKQIIEKHEEKTRDFDLAARSRLKENTLSEEDFKSNNSGYIQLFGDLFLLKSKYEEDLVNIQN